MNTVFKIIYDDVYELVDLSWRDIDYAVENGFFDLSCVITHAKNIVEDENIINDTMILELLIMDKFNYDTSEVEMILKKLIASEKDLGKEYYWHKWVYVFMKLLFSYKDTYSDPLKLVEFFYDDFGCPSEISNIVRYMPSNKSIPNNKSYNDSLLYDNWVRYLNSASESFSKSCL